MFDPSAVREILAGWAARRLHDGHFRRHSELSLPATIGSVKPTRGSHLANLSPVMRRSLPAAY